MGLPLQSFTLSQPQFPLSSWNPPKKTSQNTLSLAVTAHHGASSQQERKIRPVMMISSGSETESDDEKTQSDHEETASSPQIEPSGDLSDYVPDPSSESSSDDDLPSDSCHDEPLTRRTRNYPQASISQARKRQRETAKKVSNCTTCGTSETPEWRRNPFDKTVYVCNACGLKLAKRFKEINKRH
jgi:hypothetical protein